MDYSNRGDFGGDARMLCEESQNRGGKMKRLTVMLIMMIGLSVLWAVTCSADKVKKVKMGGKDYEVWSAGKVCRWIKIGAGRRKYVCFVGKFRETMTPDEELDDETLYLNSELSDDCIQFATEKVDRLYVRKRHNEKLIDILDGADKGDKLKIYGRICEYGITYLITPGVATRIYYLDVCHIIKQE